MNVIAGTELNTAGSLFKQQLYKKIPTFVAAMGRLSSV